MKKLTLIAVAIAALMIAAPAVFAQSSVVTASVPFDFYVGDDRMPAGEYRIAFYADTERFVFHNRSTGDVLTILTYREGQDERGLNPRLIFHSYYGKSYFLVRVVTPGHTMQELPQVSTERELAARGLPEEVTLVARVYR